MMTKEEEETHTDEDQVKDADVENAGAVDEEEEAAEAPDTDDAATETAVEEEDDEDEDDEDDVELEEEEPPEEFATFSCAIVRMPSPTVAQGITSSDLGPADYATMLQQHLSYTAVLRSLGLKIIKLPSLPDFPDAHFVEDVAVITTEVAVITRPGAEQRRGETEHIRAALAEHRPLAEIKEPGTLDGGDVLRIDRTFYVGISGRTNEAGVQQLQAILSEFGYEVVPVPLEAGLHLKSDVNYIGRNTLLLTERWVDNALFAGYEQIVVPAAETYAANTLLVNGRLLTPMGFQETHAALREAGFDILEISISEAEKMDGGLSCLSLRF